MLLAFFIFLPMIILRPSKFAITFSLGSALILSSLGFLRGWKAMFGSITSKERLVPTAGVFPLSTSGIYIEIDSFLCDTFTILLCDAAYIGSLVGTMYASMVMHSYIYSIAMCVTQFITLVYYIASFFPGGTQGMTYLASGSFSMARSAASSMFGSSS